MAPDTAATWQMKVLWPFSINMREYYVCIIASPSNTPNSVVPLSIVHIIPTSTTSSPQPHQHSLSEVLHFRLGRSPTFVTTTRQELNGLRWAGFRLGAMGFQVVGLGT